MLLVRQDRQTIVDDCDRRWDDTTIRTILYSSRPDPIRKHKTTGLAIDALAGNNSNLSSGRDVAESRAPGIAMEAGSFAYAEFARHADSRSTTLAAAPTSTHHEPELVMMRRNEYACSRGRNIRVSNGVRRGGDAWGR